MFGRSQKEKDAELNAALGHKDVAMARKALDRGASPDRPVGESNGGPLVTTVSIHSEQIALDLAALLLEKGANPNKADSDGETILHYLVKGRAVHLPVLNKLLEAGADVTASYRGATPLRAAIANGAWAAADALLAHKPDQPRPAADGVTILMLAAGSGAPAALLDKLVDASVDINAASDKGTALHAAIGGGRQEAFGWLLARPGIDLDKMDGEGRTPLLVAVLGGQKEMAGALVQAGADLNLADKAGMTPLLAAVRAGKKDFAALLLAGGADAGQADAAGVSPLLAAIEIKSDGLVKSLLAALEAGGKSVPEHDLGPALLAAAESGQTPIVEMLIAAGADVDAPDRGGRTPLMKAAASGELETLAALVKAGASTETEDLQGLKAYDHAMSAGKTQNREFLKRFRRETSVAGRAAVAASPDDRYARLNDYSLEVRESPNLSVIFNFWMGQVIYRDPSQPSPVVVQSFAEVPRQEAVNEAFEKLKALGGNPPEPALASFQKRPQGLGKG